MNYFIILTALCFTVAAIEADNNTSNQAAITTDQKPSSASVPPVPSPAQLSATSNTANSINTKDKKTDEKPKPAPSPKVIVSSSALCKKCHCDVDHKLLDCTSLNLTAWFNNDEWNTLRNGDVQFETIRLDRNSLETVPILPELPFVKKLILNYNLIKSIEATAFKDLQQLEILDLSHNRLTSKALTPAVFEGRYSPTNYEPLKNLKELNLSYNELHTLDADIFEHFPNLESLSLTGNVFQVIDHLTETAIASLTNLKNLDLSYMELQTIPEHLFHAPRNLEKLLLTGNLIKELPSALSYAINLKSLYLDENPLKNIEGENVFPKLTKLEMLSISFLRHLKQIGKSAFSGLEGLKELYATNNPYLEDIHPSAFARPVENQTTFDYPPIEKLYLHNNNLTVLPKTLLERWDKLSVIDIRMNPWKCDTDNDFLIHDLYPQIFKNTPVLTTKLVCATPENYAGTKIHEIFEKHKKLRGADRYGNHPENDGAVLIGMLIGLVIGIPLAFVSFIIYRRGCFGLIKRPNDYGGALYKRADFQDDYQI